MKIVLISNSDLTGGAAVVTTRLMHALRDRGIDASMLVINKLSDDPNIHLIGSPLGRKARFVAERAYIYAHNGFNRPDLFKVSVANFGYDLSRHKLVREADAVILAWINQGMMSLKGIERLAATGKRILWIMHDMWCMTGSCHHALDCRGYLDRCGNCRYYRHGTHANDLSRRGWTQKKRLYDEASNMTMIAVSNWLADCARAGSLLCDADVRVIHNVFPDADFYTRPKGTPLPDGIDRAKRLIVMGAARLDDPIKGFDLAIESLNRVAELEPETARQCQAVFFGTLRYPEALNKLNFNHVHTGRITDPIVIRELYASADIVLSTSRFETLPGTIIEGMAAGCTPVTTGNGGQRDIVTDGVDGYITDSTPDSVARGIISALNAPADREQQHATIKSKFGAQAVTQAIIDAATTNRMA
ncbi:MAG: glycosyltransferase [Muribaculaceae bacterium]|nr:glycosyltransferase [Muribaculaceae bacterium]